MQIDRNEAAEAWATAVILHPHPDMGGDRHNHVVDGLFRALPGAGVSTLRFDFSSSAIDVASAEVAEAIEAAADGGAGDGDGPGGPIFLAGYSFGADVAATIVDERVAGWFLVAPPLRVVPVETMGAAADERPKALAVPERDQFSSPERARSLTGGWANTTLEVVPGADHFLASPPAVAAVADQARRWVETVRH